MSNRTEEGFVDDECISHLLPTDTGNIYIYIFKSKLLLVFFFSMKYLISYKNVYSFIISIKKKKYQMLVLQKENNEHRK